jgi:hypothetical protein
MHYYLDHLHIVFASIFKTFVHQCKLNSSHVHFSNTYKHKRVTPIWYLQYLPNSSKFPFLTHSQAIDRFKCEYEVKTMEE